jgi:multiple sugar transport system permease protein
VKTRTFIAFVAPSLAMMLIFIAVPLVLVVYQSVTVSRTLYDRAEIEQCTPGFPAPVCTTEVREQPRLDAYGNRITENVFVGFDVYRQIVQPDRVAAAFSEAGRGFRDLLTIPFWRALRFTLTFTFVTLPFVLLVGLGVALAVNAVTKKLRGPVIFVSLLPFIITPVIGALSIRWLFIGDGILTDLLEWIFDRPISMFAQGWTIEVLMLFYRVWHVAPFAFVIFYAGLQTVNKDTLESAIIDGASRWERLRYVVLPHLMPLIVFVALIHLMDSYRVFEEVIGFSSQAYRISLQYLTYDFLMPDQSGTRAISSASASSMLIIVGIVILLIPLLRRTWRDTRPRY